MPDLASYLKSMQDLNSEYETLYGRPQGSDPSEKVTGKTMINGKPYYVTNLGGIWNPQGGETYGNYLGIKDQQVDNPDDPRQFTNIVARPDGGYDLVSNRGETYNFANPNPTPSAYDSLKQKLADPKFTTDESVPFNWDYNQGVLNLDSIRNNALAQIGIGTNRLNEDHQTSAMSLERNTQSSLRNQLDNMASQGLNRSGIMQQGQADIANESARNLDQLNLQRNRGLTDLELNRSNVDNSYNMNIEALKKRLLDLTQQNEAQRNAGLLGVS